MAPRSTTSNIDATRRRFLTALCIIMTTLLLPSSLAMSVRNPALLVLVSALLPLAVVAQDNDAFSQYYSLKRYATERCGLEGDDEDSSWSLILALMVVIVALALLAVCLVVVICEIRTNKPEAAPTPKAPELQLLDIGVQTEVPLDTRGTMGEYLRQEEPKIDVFVSVPASSSEESVREEPPAFDKILDDHYRLTQQSIYGRHSTVIKASMLAAPRDVVLKVYDQVDPCLHEYKFYTALSNTESTSLMYNQAKAFIPELIDAGQITVDDRSYPALVLERGHFSLRDFVVPNRGVQQYVVLSEKSTFFHICNSLRFVHNLNYAHGDLHMGSVMFFGSRWKLIDFSSWGNAESEMICRSTCHYTAPEVIHAIAKGQGTMPTAPAADVWSLGMIGWELLTKKPMLPTTEYTYEDIEAMSFGNLAYPWEGKPAQFWKDIKSPAAAKIIQNCLLRAPEQRWTVDKIIQHMKFWS